MSIIAEFRQGGDRLNLVGYLSGESRYDLDEDFHPPDDSGESVIYGAAMDIGQRVVNRMDDRNVTWEFTVHVHGSTRSELKRGIGDLRNFLRRAGKEENPLHFVWREFGDYAFEPTHGSLGKFYRYEITNGTVLTGSNYAGMVGGQFYAVTVRLTTKPRPFRRILSGLGAGSLVEDIYGAPNGRSRGLRVNPETTNYITNPIFDNPDVWNQDWTAGGDLYCDQNSDPRYYLFGKSSARLVYDGAGTGGTADTFLTATTTSALGVAMVISCFVKKVDGAAIESSDFFFVRGSTSIIGMGSGSPLPIGDGWYWCWVATTSNGGNYGIRLNNSGKYLYIDGFQLEYGSKPTFLVYGDQVGSTWSSTPHASTSTRAAGSVKWPRKIVLPSYSEGTIRLIWRPDFSTKYASSGSIHYLYSDNVIDISYDGINNRFAASDGSNSVDSTSTVLGNREFYVIHLTFDAQNGLALYVDGVQVDTNGSYTLPPVASAGTYIFLGSGTSALNHAEGTFYGFAVFDREMSDDQVAADYNALSPMLDNEERVDQIPWFWTLTGGRVYTQNDDAQNNYLIAGGFSGDVVTPEIYLSGASALDTYDEIHLGRLAVDPRDFAQIIATGVVNDRDLLFHDKNATSDSTCSGGGYEQITLNTGGTTISLFNSLFSRQNSYFQGKPVSVMGRVCDAGGGGVANLQTSVTYRFGAQTYTPDYVNLPALSASVFGLIEFGQVTFPPGTRFRPEGGMWDRLYVTPIIKRSTGSGNFRTDFIALLPWPLHIFCDGITMTRFVLRGDAVRCVRGTYTAGDAEIELADTLQYDGWGVEFEGDRLNIVNFLIGKRNNSLSTITWYLTIDELWLTIRDHYE